MQKSYLVLFLLISQCFCGSHKVNTDFLSLISTQSSIKSTNDAIKAVLQLLNDLKGANEEAQKKADQSFNDFEGQALADVSEFTKIMNQNNDSLQKNTEDIDSVDDKIQQTQDYLDWNEKRRKSNDKKLEDLAEQRCEANSLFIDALRDYKETLNVLDWVKGDLTTKDKTQLIEKGEINEYADKLSMYASMFKETELQDFVKLGDEETEQSLIQTDEAVTDEMSKEEMANQVVNAVIAKVQSLIEKIKTHIKILEEQEITSSNDFVDFRKNLINEQQSLSQEYDSRQKFLQSLLNDRELAKDVVDQCADILHNTQRILQQSQDQYNQQKQQYQLEKQKRHEENQMIEEVILIYKQKIADAKLFLQKKVGDQYVQMDEENDDEE